MKKILLFLKSLFKKKVLPKEIIIEEKTIEEVVKEEKTTEDIVIEEIKELIQQTNLLDEVSVGSVIWAKRYKNSYEEQEIEEGHKEGPYIVLDKIDNKLICSYGTSTEPPISQLKKYIKIGVGKYNLIKDTYFRLNYLEIIDEKSFINVMDLLEKSDKDLIFNRLKGLNNCFYYDYGAKKPINISLQIGDIIKYKYKNYLVLDINEEDNKMTCLELDYEIYNLTVKDFDSIDYSKIKQINKNDDYKILSSINENLLLYVLKKQKESLEEKEIPKEVQRGSLISIDNKYYYVYGEEGQDWLVFEVSKTNELNLEEIKINKNAFYTNYKGKKINKKDKMKIVLIASEEEIEIIKNAKKTYSKNHKKEEVKSTPKSFFIGNIIVSKEFRNDRFIIIGNCKNNYECISINNIIKGRYFTTLIKRNSCSLSTNKSIEGIKWLEEHPEFNLGDIDRQEYLNRIFNRQDEFIDNEYSISIKSFTSKSKIKKEDINFGSSIIKDGKEYIVIEVIDNSVNCVSKNELGEKKYILETFNIDSISRIKELNIEELKNIRIKLMCMLSKNFAKVIKKNKK